MLLMPTAARFTLSLKGYFLHRKMRKCYVTGRIKRLLHAERAYALL